MAVTDDIGRPDPAGAPTSTGRRRRTSQPSSRVLGGMLLSKDAIADVVEVLRAGDFYRPAHADRLRRDPRPLRPGRAGRRGHGRGRADPRGPADAGRRRALPAHPDLLGADRRQRRLLRGDRAEQAILRRLVEAGTRIVQLGYGAPRPGRRRRRRRRPGPGRDLRRHREAHQRGLRPPRRLDGVDDGRDRGDLLAAAASIAGVPTGFSELDQITNGLHPGQMIVIAARPGDRQNRRWRLDFARSCRSSTG